MFKKEIKLSNVHINNDLLDKYKECKEQGTIKIKLHVDILPYEIAKGMRSK